MAWCVEIDQRVYDDLSRLDRQDAVRIVNFIEERLTQHPNPITLAKSLSGKLAGLSRFRVGDFRLVAEVDVKEKRIYLIKVAHRREIYD